MAGGASADDRAALNVPRHNRRRRPDPPRALSGVTSRIDSWRGEDYVVRTVPASTAAKQYRCPGCDQQIPLGAPHVVVWPADAPDADDRRHWHAACWTARETRRPGPLRGRSAPRY